MNKDLIKDIRDSLDKLEKEQEIESTSLVKDLTVSQFKQIIRDIVRDELKCNESTNVPYIPIPVQPIHTNPPTGPWWNDPIYCSTEKTTYKKENVFNE